MADIIIGDISPRIQAVGDGVQTEFVYPFPIFHQSDLQVYIDDVLQEGGYVVTGAGLSQGGTVQFAIAPAQNVTVTLNRYLVAARISDFAEGGAFHARVINTELDKIIALIQQTLTEQSRSVQLATYDSSATLMLPVKNDRAGKVLGFDQNGNIVASVSVAVIEAFEGAVSVAVQSAESAEGDAQAAHDARLATEAAAATVDLTFYRKKADLIQTADIENGAVTQEKIDPSVQLGGPSLGENSIIRTNGTIIDEDITVPAGTNGMSAGPITIAVGRTVTVEGTWTVVGG